MAVADEKGLGEIQVGKILLIMAHFLIPRDNPNFNLYACLESFLNYML